jgi:hypothetical protein
MHSVLSSGPAMPMVATLARISERMGDFSFMVSPIVFGLHPLPWMTHRQEWANFIGTVLSACFQEKRKFIGENPCFIRPLA